MWEWLIQSSKGPIKLCFTSGNNIHFELDDEVGEKVNLPCVTEDAKVIPFLNISHTQL
jgi:hypothetical protein